MNKEVIQKAAAQIIQGQISDRIHTEIQRQKPLMDKLIVDILDDLMKNKEFLSDLRKAVAKEVICSIQEDGVDSMLTSSGVNKFNRILEAGLLKTIGLVEKR